MYTINVTFTPVKRKLIMKIDFKPSAKFAKVLVGETISSDKKSVDRFFAYEKSSRNPYNNKIRVMRQTLNETQRGWLVTDMEVYDSKTGRIIKTLKRNVDEEGKFNTQIVNVGVTGKKNLKQIEHSADGGIISSCTKNI